YDKDGDGFIGIKDLKLLTKDDVVNRVLKPHYWDRWQADRINSQSIANILVDWVWASGVHGIKRPQKLLGIVSDGIVGEQTLATLNNYTDQKKLFENIKAIRINFLYEICKEKPKNKKFLKGWLNRLNQLKFEP
ncbi:MAG: putative peptidoglycan-binding domain-containing protein, partial [Dysgonomonas sp.]